MPSVTLNLETGRLAAFQPSAKPMLRPVPAQIVKPAQVAPDDADNDGEL